MVKSFSLVGIGTVSSCLGGGGEGSKKKKRKLWLLSCTD